MKRPKIITGLMIFFIYTAYREGSKLLTPSIDPGYYLSAALDWGEIYSGLTILQIILLIASSCFFIWPRPNGFWVVLSTILLMIVRGGLVAYLTTLDPESTLIAIEEAFRQKGREFTPEHIELMQQVNILAVGFGLSILFSAILGLLLFMRRDYFRQYGFAEYG